MSRRSKRQAGSSPARRCRRCGAGLVPMRVARYDPLLCLGLVLLGSLTSLLVLGLPLIAVGSWMWIRTELGLGCPACSQEAEPTFVTQTAR